MNPLDPISDQLDEDQPSRRTKTRYEKGSSARHPKRQNVVTKKSTLRLFLWIASIKQLNMLKASKAGEQLH